MKAPERILQLDVSSLRRRGWVGAVCGPGVVAGGEGRGGGWWPAGAGACAGSTNRDVADVAGRGRAGCQGAGGGSARGYGQGPQLVERGDEGVGPGPVACQVDPDAAGVTDDTGGACSSL